MRLLNLCLVPLSLASSLSEGAAIESVPLGIYVGRDNHGPAGTSSLIVTLKADSLADFRFKSNWSGFEAADELDADCSDVPYEVEQTSPTQFVVVVGEGSDCMYNLVDDLNSAIRSENLIEELPFTFFYSEGTTYLQPGPQFPFATMLMKQEIEIEMTNLSHSALDDAETLSQGSGEVDQVASNPLEFALGIYKGVDDHGDQGMTQVVVTLRENSLADFDIRSNWTGFEAELPLLAGCQHVGYAVSETPLGQLTLHLGEGNDCMQTLVDTLNSQIQSENKFGDLPFHFMYTDGNDYLAPTASFPMATILIRQEDGDQGGDASSDNAE
jgi:hypothetical protein